LTVRVLDPTGALKSLDERFHVSTHSVEGPENHA
jgi:hypothetical protein